ncbi:MAG: 2-phospho-L-lactate guanylyltransferase [Ktedonobacterales bacterium]
MKTVAVVPINALALAKSRLAGTLAPEDRRELVLWMASRVLRAVQQSASVAALAVVSPDRDALQWASERGAIAISQDGGRLNAGLFQARRWALACGAEALLVLLADLPLLTPEEVHTFVAVDDTPAPAPTVALAPDRRRIGTNGLLLRPVDALPFAFGRASFSRHSELATTEGISPRVFASPGFAFDVDEPDDIETLRARNLWTPKYNVVSLTAREGAR